MANIFQRMFRNWTDVNKFNYSFMSQYGGEYTTYDQDNKTYLEKGYNFNSIVYSIINKQSIKTSSIPFYIKKIQDENAKNQLDNLQLSTKGKVTPTQRLKLNKLKTKAFTDEYLEIPLEKPNPLQSWAEFNYMYKTFIKLTGNVYVYMLMPDDGMNKGVPIAVYLLPSHLIKIVTKDNASMLGIESPIKSYMLIQGKQYIEFEAEKVLHIKYANPNYDEDGEHLYGFAPLKAGLRNVNSSNAAVDNNIKTLANSGAFGFIFGKNATFTEGQVKEIKERLIEMDNNPDRLSKLSALSGEIGFQRISLTTDELKPFDYLAYDEKQLCNVLGYSVLLLNSSEGAKYDNVNAFRKAIVTDDIKPDLQLLEQGFWKPFLAKFKGYDNTLGYYDISELPEMQDDMVQLAEWATKLQDRGDLNGNEIREMFSFPESGLNEHSVYTVANDVLTLSEAIESEFNIEPNKE